MAKVRTLVDFTYGGEEYPRGTELDLPRRTDLEKAEFERLVSRGVVTTKLKVEEKPAEPEPEQAGRTGRGRRS